ncbi:MAG: hypothetical protein ACRDIB_18960, partial [Ardenticatenaceae bacterium]
MNTQPLNPKAWLDAVDEQWNSHNVEGILETFTDDGVLCFAPPLPDAPEGATGKAQIRALLEPL